jgi:hypothetical protein
MTKTAIGAADPGGGAHMSVMWHIEEYMATLHRPFWSISEMRHDEDAALDRLRTLRIRHPDKQWRVKKVTTMTTEEVLNA